jgi:hypothetical protein
MGTPFPADERQLVGISADKVGMIWPTIKPLMLDAVTEMGTHEIEDVLAAIIQRDWQLWLSVRSHIIEAVCITQINVCPKIKVCRIVLVVGDGMKDWVHLEDGIADWAKGQGCCKVVGELRPGWKKILPHWSFGNIVAERIL